MKAHIGVDANSGLVHIVRFSRGKECEITTTHRLLHEQEKYVWDDDGYQSFEKHPGADPVVALHVAMCSDKRKTLKQAG
jgi:IS5 family transposase